MPHDRVRRVLTVLATPEVVRVVEGDDVVAEHIRCFDKGHQVEDPAHIEALRQAKRNGREQRSRE